MEIFIAKTSGFCFGVKRAVDMIESLLAQGVKVCTLGPLIHNKTVVDNFAKRGVVVVKNVDDVPNGYILVIRSHGISEEKINYIERKSIKYIDTTCPFVKKIHKIVKKESNLGKIILIVGDKNHPEVEGIVGYCSGKYFVFKNSEELEKICKSNINSKFLDVILVAQTTFDIREWNKCVNLTKNLFTNPIIYDTICNTTQLRQKEAEILSKNTNLMIIIGGKNSSNTSKLYNICKRNCRSVLVESAKDLDLKCLRGCKSIGVTAGASTPKEIIEEVEGAMLENSDIDAGKNENFEELLEKSLKDKSRGGKVKGTVVSINANEVYVDVGMKQSGIIPKSELTRAANVKLDEIVKIGDELELLIIKTDDQEGTVTLSKIRLDEDNEWKNLVSSKDSKSVLTGTVSGVVKSGILVYHSPFNVFIPSSHIGGNKSIPLESYIDKEVRFIIIELDRYKRRIIGSMREVKNQEKAEKLDEFWESIEVGKVYTGVVKSITSYAVFVDLGYIDGIVHISELTWDRKKKPEEVVSVGQEVEVKVKSFDREREKVSLTYKNPNECPWEIIKSEYKEGTIFDSEIVGIVPFGAFAKIIPGIDGLIHISQISDKRIEKPEDVLTIGQKVRVKVRHIDDEKQKVSLTMRGIED